MHRRRHDRQRPRGQRVGRHLRRVRIRTFRVRILRRSRQGQEEAAKKNGSRDGTHGRGLLSTWGASVVNEFEAPFTFALETQSATLSLACTGRGTGRGYAILLARPSTRCAVSTGGSSRSYPWIWCFVCAPRDPVFASLLCPSSTTFSLLGAALPARLRREATWRSGRAR